MVSIIDKKSKAFALRIIKLYKQLKEVDKEFVLSKQILRSGTSIGANARFSAFTFNLLIFRFPISHLTFNL